jgi:hypothetical protein
MKWKFSFTATFDCIGSDELKFDAVVDDGSSTELLFVVVDFFCDSNNWFVICWISVRIDVVSGSSLPDARINVSCNSRKRFKSGPPEDF